MRRTSVWVLLLGLAALPRPTAGQEVPLKQVQTIPLPGVQGRFDHFAADLPGRRLFLAALGHNSLEVLDLQGGRVARSVKGLRMPQGVAFAPDLGRVFVGEGEGAACTILDGTSLAVLQRVTGLEDADNVRYDAAGKRVYVGYGSGALAVLDAATGKLVKQIRLAGHPESFQLEKSGSRIFVNVPSAGQVAVIDRKSLAVTATWKVTGAAAQFPMALDERGHRLLVGCRNPARLLAFDTETGKQVASTEIVGDTDDLFFDASRKRVYVIGGEGAITILAQRTPDRYERLGQVATRAGARTGYFVPELRRLYVAVPRRGSADAEVRVYAVAP